MDHSSRIVAHLTLSGPIFLPLGTTSLDILILIPWIIGPYGAPPSMQYLVPSFPASHTVHVHGNLSPSLIPAPPACNPVLPMCLCHLPNTLRNVINPALPVVPTRKSTCCFYCEDAIRRSSHSTFRHRPRLGVRSSTGQALSPASPTIHYPTARRTAKTPSSILRRPPAQVPAAATMGTRSHLIGGITHYTT